MGDHDTIPYHAYGIFDGSGTGNFTVACSAGGVYSDLTVTSALTNNTPLFLVGRYNGSALESFINGVKQAGSTACSGVLTYPNVATAGPSLGNYYNFAAGTRSFNGLIFLAGVSDVALSDLEIQQLSKNPWQIFSPYQDELYVNTTGTNSYTHTGSGGIVFAGTAPLVKAKVFLPSGGVTFSGTAPKQFSTSALWTVVTPASGVWTAVTPASGVWTAVPPATTIWS